MPARPAVEDGQSPSSSEPPGLAARSERQCLIFSVDKILKHVSFSNLIRSILGGATPELERFRPGWPGCQQERSRCWHGRDFHRGRVPVRAQDWLGGAVTIIVPYTPGGAADTLTRMIQDGLSKRLGQSILIENKLGGSGIPGTDMVVRSSDGLTIGLSVHATSVALKMSLLYDPLNDITPLSLLGRVPLILVVPRQLRRRPQRS